MADVRLPRTCPTCDCHTVVKLLLAEEDSLVHEDTGIVAVTGRLDSVELSCPNGHPLPATDRNLRVTGISADVDGVVLARLEPRP